MRKILGAIIAVLMLAGAAAAGTALNLMPGTSTTVNGNMYSSLNAAVAAAAGLTQATVEITGPIPVIANLTVPANVGLRVLQGGMITNSVSAPDPTLAIGGAFSAPLKLVLKGFTDGTVTFGAGSVQQIDPLWFGADPTDTQFSDGAIQNAIDSAPASGGTVFLPAGKYLMDPNGYLLSLKTGIDFYGAGDSTVLDATNATNGTNGIFPNGHQLISNEQFSNGHSGSNIYLHDMAVEGPCTSSTAVTTTQINDGVAINFTGSVVAYNNIKISRLHITGFCGGSIVVQSGSTRVDNVQISHNTISGGAFDGINLNTAAFTNGVIEDNYISDMGGNGIEGPASGDVIARNLVLGAKQVGILVSNYGGGEIIRAQILHNTVSACGVTNNHAGIEVEGSGCLISGNEVDGCAGFGIAAGYSSPNSGLNAIITNNILHGNSTSTATPRTDLYIEPSATNTLIEGNTLWADGSTVPTYSIYISATASGTVLDSNLINGTYGSGSGAASIDDLGSSTWANQNGIIQRSDFYPIVSAVGSLPVCSASLLYVHRGVNNCAAAPTAGGTCTAGGSYDAEVICNGSAWMETGR